MRLQTLIIPVLALLFFQLTHVAAAHVCLQTRIGRFGIFETGLDGCKINTLGAVLHDMRFDQLDYFIVRQKGARQSIAHWPRYGKFVGLVIILKLQIFA